MHNQGEKTADEGIEPPCSSDTKEGKTTPTFRCAGTPLKSLLMGSVLGESTAPLPEAEAAGNVPAVGTDTEAPSGSSAALGDNADTTTNITPLAATSTPEAAGAHTVGGEATGGSSAPEAEGADTATGTTPTKIEPITSEAEPEVEPALELEAANDNQPATALPAIGSD